MHLTYGKMCFLPVLVDSVERASRSVLQWVLLLCATFFRACSNSNRRLNNCCSRLTIKGSSNSQLCRSYLTWSSLPEEHTMLREMCRNFADNELAPNAGEWDRNHTFPKDQVRVHTHYDRQQQLLYNRPLYMCCTVFNSLKYLVFGIDATFLCSTFFATRLRR